MLLVPVLIIGLDFLLARAAWRAAAAPIR
jgi:hypothetical protein